ncbi:MAG: Catabolite control protein A [Anaerolineae bacterium]|nr:Catabolite control protein A [Anaerolineae bacterium]
MPVTLRDVARKAGVSIKTVSRVVNNQSEISEDTRQRVQDVIDELGYRPNLIARGLVTQRSFTVGLIFPDITNPFFPEVARGVQDTARARDYNTLLCNSDESQQEELRTLHSLAAQGVDGIIIFPCYHTGDNLTTFAEQYRPVISVNSRYDDPNISMILSDNYGGSKQAVEHLIGRGHRHIAMLAGLEISPLRAQRVLGFLDIMAAHGLPLPDSRLTSGLPMVDSGYERALQLLTDDPQITAIVAYNDLLALGAMNACKKLGRRIPADCAIIGFDDIQLASLVTPTLTTIRLDKYDIGRQAMIRLLEMLDNPDATYPPIHLGAELVIREST